MRGDPFVALLVVTTAVTDWADGQNWFADFARKASPFEATYYTDYYQGGHKLYREVIGKITKRRLQCGFIGDRQLIAALIGDPNATISDPLRKLAARSARLPVVNETTAEVDDRIDSCVQSPPDETDSNTPGLKKFMRSLTRDDDDLIDYLFIFPGTKWCGAGDVAKNYNDLGSQSATDRCCRTHDHANISVAAGETFQGLKNPLPYTMTGCDHDAEFRECLTEARNPHSSFVGAMFFNILKTKCIDKRKEARCVKDVPLLPCLEYEYVEDSEARWQIFDPEQFEPNTTNIARIANDVLYHIPGIDNIINLFA